MYIYIYEQETSVCMCCALKIKQKTQRDCGFAYIKSEAAVLSFPSYSCYDDFLKFTRKIPMLGSSF